MYNIANTVDHKKNAISACKFSQTYNLDFKRDVKFTLIEKITKLATTQQLQLIKLMYSEAKNTSSIRS